MPGNYLGQVCAVETHIGNSSCLDSVFAAVAAANVGGVTTTAPGMHNVTTTSTDEFAAAVAAAQAADVVVFVGGNDESVEGEMRDRTAIDLPGAQHALVAALAAVGKPLVVVLLSGSSLDVSAERDSAGVGAMLFAGYPGTFGGWAIASTLFGTNDHLGGKLATTWYPSSYVDLINMTEMELDTGVGRGYRFYSGTPVFPFGWGLSLTTFEYLPTAGGWPSAADAAGALTTAAAGAGAPPLRSLQYAVQVTNTGAVTGDDVVFLFMEPVATPTQPRSRLLRQLLDYRRVHLAPGASATVAFNVSARSLALVDRDTGDVVSAPGTFRVVVTNGARARLAQEVAVRGEQALLEAFPARV
jgi:beta-D-xylosidase 4